MPSVPFDTDPVAAPYLASERQVLVELFTATNGPRWTTRTWWNSSVPYCLWSGVTCDTAGHVTSFTSRANKMKGTLPVSLGRLPALQAVSIHTELYLSGTLPASLLCQPLLRQLDLRITAMSGPLPSLRNLTRLEYVQLSGMRLSGDVAALDLHLLRSLKSLVLFRPGNVTGKLSLDTVSQDIEEIVISQMPALHGNLDDFQLCTKPRLSTLKLIECPLLGGTLPSCVQRLPLEDLQLRGLGISGTLPALAPLTRLRSLHMHDNAHLRGKLPSLPRSLESLAVVSEALDGEFPDLTGMANLTVLDVYFCPRLSGPVLHGLQSATKLSALRVSQLPHVEGTIPPLGHLSALGEATIAALPLVSGTLPRDVAGLVSLSTVTISFLPLLSGTIPDGLGRLPQLRVLDLSRNALEGPIVGDVVGPRVTRLDLSRNRLTRLDQSVFASERLMSLSVAYNDIRTTQSFCPMLYTPRDSVLAEVDISGIRWPDESFDLNHAMFCFALPRLQRIIARNTSLPGWLYLNPDLSFLFPMMQEFDLTHNDLRGYIDPAVIDGFLPFPFLQVVRVADNPSFAPFRESGASLNLGFLSVLDISRTQVDLCLRHDTLLRSDRTDDLFLYDVHMNEAADCNQDPRTLVPCPRGTHPDIFLCSDTQNRVSYFEQGLTCPQWKSGSGAELHTSRTFLDYFNCTCQPQHYFGYANMAHAEQCAYGRRTPNQRCDGGFMMARSCFACPTDGAHTCDPRALLAPEHALVGSVYPFFGDKDSHAEAAHRAAIWFVHATPLRCPFSSVCNVAGPGEDFQCAEGHDPSTLLCSKCQEGYFSIGFRCFRCRSSYQWLVPLTTCLLPLPLLWYMLSYLPRKNPPLGATFSITFFWLQLMSVLERSNQFNEFGQGTDASLSGVQSVQRGLQAIGAFRPYAWECVDPRLNLTFRIGTLFSMPLVVAALFVVSTVLKSPRLKLAAVFSADVLFFPLSDYVFSVLRCSHTPDGNYTYMASAPWLSCESGTYRALLAVGIVLLVVVVLGQPLAVGYALFRRSRAAVMHIRHASEDLGDVLASETPSVAERQRSARYWTQRKRWGEFAPLIEPVHSGLWFWPVAVVQARKVLVAMFVRLLPIDSIFVPFLVLATLLASLLAQLTFRPYRAPHDNMLEVFVLASAMALYLVNLLLGISTFSATSRDAAQAASTVMTLSSWVFIGGVLFYAIIYRRMQKRWKQQREGASSDDDANMSADDEARVGIELAAATSPLARPRTGVRLMENDDLRLPLLQE